MVDTNPAIGVRGKSIPGLAIQDPWKESDHAVAIPLPLGRLNRTNGFQKPARNDGPSKIVPFGTPAAFARLTPWNFLFPWDLKSNELSMNQQILKAGPTILVLGALALAWLSVHHILNESEVAPAGESGEVPSASLLVLPEGKWNAAEIKCSEASLRPVQDYHTVPGRLRYDATKHIEIKVPIAGILENVLVQPGDTVQKGQVLAIVRSPEIGKSRGRILQRKQQAAIVESSFRREQAIAENLERLLNVLQQKPKMESIQKQFEGQALGGYRQEIMASFARYQLAASLLEKLSPLAESGAVAGKTFRQRQAELQLAETEFATACDQAGFKARQAVAQAEADWEQAEREVQLARQDLAMLLGYTDSVTDEEDEASLARLSIRAPLFGTIETRQRTNEERVEPDETLLVLADTQSLYVEASIRESDWTAIGLEAGRNVKVALPALGDLVVSAQVVYAGREVVVDSNAVPLVASLENPDGVLRPGMFVRVTIPMGEPRETLCVAPESVMTHENKSFVFVCQGQRTVQKVDVETGQKGDGCIEVLSGLKVGQQVVVDGAFLLKSELLLQGEGE